MDLTNDEVFHSFIDLHNEECGGTIPCEGEYCEGFGLRAEADTECGYCAAIERAIERESCGDVH